MLFWYYDINTLRKNTNTYTHYIYPNLVKLLWTVDIANCIKFLSHMTKLEFTVILRLEAYNVTYLTDFYIHVAIRDIICDIHKHE